MQREDCDGTARPIPTRGVPRRAQEALLREPHRVRVAVAAKDAQALPILDPLLEHLSGDPEAPNLLPGRLKPDPPAAIARLGLPTAPGDCHKDHIEGVAARRKAHLLRRGGRRDLRDRGRSRERRAHALPRTIRGRPRP